MIRTQVALTLFLAFAAVGGVLYFQVDARLTEQTQAGIDGRLKAARAAVVRARQLNEYWVAALAEQVADAPSLGALLAKRPEAFADAAGLAPDEETFRYEVHKRMNEEVLAWRTRFEAIAGGKAAAPAGVAGSRTDAPDWFVVVDAAGVGVANAADKAWYGPGESDVLKGQPALKAVLEQGQSLRDVWTVKGSPMTVGAAPVRVGETIVGAVIIGQRLTEQEVRRQAGLVGTDVAHYRGTDFTQSTSLSSDLEPQLAAAFAGAGLLAGKATEGNVALTLGGRDWRVAVEPLTGYPSVPDTGVAVLVDSQSLLAEARSVLVLIPLICGAAFVLSLVLFVVFQRRFVAPFEEIDRGVMELLNGDPKNPEYWFDVPGKSLAGTMSQNLNIMVCNLSGRPLPEDLEEQAKTRAAEAGA